MHICKLKLRSKNMTVEDIQKDGQMISESLSTIAEIIKIVTDLNNAPEGDASEDGEKPENGNPGLGLDTIGTLNEAGLGAALGTLSSTGLFKESAPRLLVGALQSIGVVLSKENKYAPKLSAKHAASLATLITNVFKGIAEAETEDYSAETALMSDLLKMTIKAKFGTATRLFTDAVTGEKGKMDVTAENFVYKVIASEIIADAIKQSNLGNDPFGVAE